MGRAQAHGTWGVWCLLAVTAVAGNAWCETTVTRAAYTATVDDGGMLASLQVGDAQVLGQPVAFCPGVSWTAADTQEEGDGEQVGVLLKSDRGDGQVQYTFGAQRAVISLTHRLGGYQSWQLTLSEDVLAVESLQNNTVTGAEAIQYLDRGEVRATPLVGLSRVQRARLHLRNGATVLFWHDGWGAPFNLDEMGAFRDFGYRRNLLENDKPMRVCFEVEEARGRSLQAAPAFVPTPGVWGGMFYAGEPIRFTLRFTDATKERLSAARRWRVSWAVRDFRDEQVADGGAVFDAESALADGAVSAEFSVPTRGWFSVLFALGPAAKADPGVVASEFRTRFAVVDRHPGFPGRPEAGAELSDYGYAALLGLKCIRESHEMRRFFPEKGKADWQALDQIMERAHQEARRWGVEWLFQANARPDWCTEADYEQLAYEVVSRYKDWCKVWEVENEPNFGMSPEDYVVKALVPFARGAKRADPQCQVIGPACVCVPETLRFMDAVIAADALRHLDGIATHTYVGPGNPWELYGNPERLRRLGELAGGRPLWQTEQGYSWGHVPKQEHARYVVRQFLQGFAAGIANERHYYFYPVHHGFEPWYLVEMGSSEGLNGTLEPAAVALRVLNEQTDGLTVGEMAQPAFGVYALRFAGEQEDVVAVWTLDFPLALTVRGRVLNATDFMGNARELRRARGGVTVPVDGYALYVHVPHDEELTVVGPGFGVNHACADQGSGAQASSATEAHPAEHAIDGIWAPRDPVPEGHPDWIGTYWEDAQAGASAEEPDWLQVTFPAERTINRALVLTPLPAVSAVPRDFAIQVSDDGQKWRTVAEAKRTATWAHLLTFRAVKARHARLLITALNDGWHLDGTWMFMVRDDFTRYTSMQTMVLELMLFGPAPGA